MNRVRSSTLIALQLGTMLLVAMHVAAQTPSPALLVLEKSDNTLAVVDPAKLQVVARVPAGEDPHEVIASDDGKLAYISNYGGEGSTLNTISVVDLVAQKALHPIDLGALHSPHGLAMGGGELYFTAETSKVIGRYDPRDVYKRQGEETPDVFNSVKWLTQTQPQVLNAAFALNEGCLLYTSRCV